MEQYRTKFQLLIELTGAPKVIVESLVDGEHKSWDTYTRFCLWYTNNSSPQKHMPIFDSFSFTHKENRGGTSITTVTRKNIITFKYSRTLETRGT